MPRHMFVFVFSASTSPNLLLPSPSYGSRVSAVCLTSFVPPQFVPPQFVPPQDVRDSLTLISFRLNCSHPHAHTHTRTCTRTRLHTPTLLHAQAGDNMGALLRGVRHEQIKHGQVIIAPGSMNPITKFQAQMYVSTGIMNQFRQSQLSSHISTDDEGMLLYTFIEEASLIAGIHKVVASMPSGSTTGHSYFLALLMLLSH